MTTSLQYPQTREQWREALAALPSLAVGGKIPAFYFGHGQPMLIWPETIPPPADRNLFSSAGPSGPLAQFLRDFGPTLIEKYNPRAVVVFSAHWETRGERQVTDYEDSNPLLMDYFGFPPELYKVQFKSHGDSALSQKIVNLFKENGISARTIKQEPRGSDGRGFSGPGLDHGVFVPFKLMFGDVFDIPIVQVSIDESLSLEKNWKIGKALDQLRSEGVLILSGGLIIHTFRDFSAFSENTAKPIYKAWHKAVIDAAGIANPEARRKAMMELVSHPGFRPANPREEHFIPIYIAAGCGEDGEARVLSGIHGSPTFAFGV